MDRYKAILKKVEEEEHIPLEAIKPELPPNTLVSEGGDENLIVMKIVIISVGLSCIAWTVGFAIGLI